MRTPEPDDALISALRDRAQRLKGNEADYDRLITRVGDARFALLGEASHGTHEFYRERAEITKRLIRGKGFTAVAIEADWPCLSRNRYVQGASKDIDAAEALSQHGRCRVRRVAQEP